MTGRWIIAGKAAHAPALQSSTQTGEASVRTASAVRRGRPPQPWSSSSCGKKLPASSWRGPSLPAQHQKGVFY